ncbi:hypothetical protein K504DRAFT_459569, partial [Pleomassaria siparia CBS 279.74]
MPPLEEGMVLECGLWKLGWRPARLNCRLMFFIAVAQRRREAGRWGGDGWDQGNKAYGTVRYGGAWLDFGSRMRFGAL